MSPRLIGRLAAFVCAHTAAYVLFVVSWIVLGHAAFTGTVGTGELLGWAGLLAAAVPFHLMATRFQASVAIEGGRALRRRLLGGALELEPEEVRGEGVGRLLGRVLEAEAVEDLALGGGMLGLVAVVELALAGAALAAGPGPVPAFALAAWVCGTLALAWRYLLARRNWARARLALTDDVVEKMLGHRTRLAQQPPDGWHAGETEALHRYETLGRAMDRRLAVLVAMSPRGWLATGALGLWLSATGGATPAALAAGAGGVLLATGALRTLVTGLAQLADASAAWHSVRPLVRAAARRGDEPVTPPDPVDGAPLLTADGVEFGYPGRNVLAGAALRITAGERVLMDGRSGSGKSTVVSLLAGLRAPTGGVLRLHGRTRAETGSTHWRRRIVAVPQFHENHIVQGPLAFNLLMGRGWPATQADLDAAAEVCRRLGLGQLVERMPSGLGQLVGETGWQLSHGERSLVCLARALLQRPDLMILDETFAPLDPATRCRARDAVTDLTPTILVTHHR
ncbi:MAG TPA: ABC transporter ATP-binding protein [Actinophytocola sp.]|uniref:ABC transporter ATP-binding protein n=1 Tax=Actinophytocola sp. TaxID=1872138 RepID=UPI002DDC93E7|nr:ABC transporter ATP-binding protein [Actinophytocola sp.]HEV2779402.1 ABC transporter ATP-binding protein [Actinophytocola sp.]